MKQPLILSIDTSCDETSVAISSGRRILSNVISSQINIHKKYGGVVPFLAKRAHLEKIDSVVSEALERAKVGKFQERKMSGEIPDKRQVESPTIEHLKILSTKQKNNLDAIAVTIGPGLAPALEVGVNYAKKLAQDNHLPLIAINHMEGHLLSSLTLNSKGNGPLCQGSEPLHRKIFPALGILISGGHTEIILAKKIGQYEILGQTLDDAAGEALDKLSKMMKLGYPGGPIIEEIAKLGNPNSIDLPIPMQHQPTLDMSFSGLKTAALYKIRDQKGLTLKGRSDIKSDRNKSEQSEEGSDLIELSVQYTQNMAASFQKAVALSITVKLKKAIKLHSPKSLLLGGGVISNLYIRNQIRKTAKSFNLPVYLPYSKKLFTDNAAMIAIPAYYKYLKKDFVKNIDKLDRQPSLTL